MIGNAFAFCMLVATILAVAIAAFDSRLVRFLCLGLAAAVPAAIAFSALDRNSPAFGDVRLRLEAASFGREAQTPVRIGGDPDADDIFIAGLPAHVTTIRGGTMIQAWPLERGQPRAGVEARPAEAAMASIDSGAGETFLGAYAIGPDDRFCLESCAEPGPTWYRVNAARTRLVADGSEESALPQFRKRPLFPALGDLLADTLIHYRPSQAIYPVRDYGRPWRGPADSFLDTCRTRFVCDRATRLPVRSFLFRDNGRQLFLALLDRNAILETRDADGAFRQVTAAGPASRSRLDGRANGVKLTIWQVAYAGADVDFTTAERPSHLIRRRVLNATLDPARLTLGFAREPTRVIAQQDLRFAAARLRRGGLDAPVAIVLTGWPRTGAPDQVGNVIRLDAIGGPLAAAIAPEGGHIGSLIFSSGFTEPGAADSLLPEVGGGTERGTARPGVRTFEFGGRDTGGRSVQLSVDRFTFPATVRLVIVSWAILFACLQFAVWRDDRSALVIASGLQLMLLLRIFVAIGSAALDPQIDYHAVLGDALIAYCLLPFALAWLFPAREPGRFDYVPAGLAVAALGAILYRDGSASLGLAAAALLAGGAALFRGLVLRAARAFASSAGPGWLDRWQVWPGLFAIAGLLGWFGMRLAAAVLALAALAGAARYLWSLSRRGLVHAWVRRHRRWPPVRLARRALLVPPPGARLWVLIACLLFLIRLALLLGLNAKERYGIALSVVHLPVSLYVVAGLFNAVRRASTPRRAARVALWTAGVILLLFVVVPTLVADRGFAFVYLPAILIMAIAFVRKDWRRRARWVAAMPGIGTLALVAASVAIAGLSSMRHMPDAPLSATAAPDREALLASLRSATDTSRDWWRYEAVISPDSLNEAGTSAAEQIRRWRFLLASFTAEPYGRGFPYKADVSDLRQVQADDNVSAIHLMAPFGRTGAAMFVLLLGATAFGASRASKAPAGARRVAAELALWTIFAAGSYMILANLVLVPFTGRNVYFLAALSDSDLLEGGILMAMALAGLVVRRRAE